MIESELFSFLKENYYPDLEKSQKMFSPYDCYSKEFRCLIELKCRTTHYNRLLIEKIKYDKLISYGCDLRYICSTPKGVYSFDLLAISPEWEESNKNPKTTEFKNTNKVIKIVSYISIENAIILK